MSTPAHFTMKLQPGALASARRLLRGAPKRFPQHRVHLGIHETEGSEPKTKYDGTAGELNLATVAMFHEFGIGVPDRSWLRSWFDTNLSRFGGEMLAAMTAEYNGDRDACRRLAHDWAVELKAWIANQEGALAALSPRTVAEKTKHGLPHPDVPLVATEQLVGAIRATIDGRPA